MKKIIIRNYKSEMSKLKCLYAFLLLIIGVDINAQHLAIYSQYSESIGLINPSALNNEFLLNGYNASISAIHRSQWQELNNSPHTSNINGEFIWRNDGRFNLLSGLYVQNDSDGKIETNGIYGRIGVIGNFSSYGNLSGISAGLLVGMVQYRVKNASSIAQDPNDPQLFIAAESQLYPDIGLGISYHHEFNQGMLERDRIQLGISVPQIFGLNPTLRNENNEFNLERQAHYYSTFQYTRFVNDSNYLEFSGWVRMVRHVPVSMDMAVRYLFSDIMWIGGGYSTANIAHAEFGLRLGGLLNMEESNFKISYSFERGLNSFAPLFGPTHELTASYSFSTEY